MMLSTAYRKVKKRIERPNKNTYILYFHKFVSHNLNEFDSRDPCYFTTWTNNLVIFAVTTIFIREIKYKV
jgi:hypothetical protein